MAESNYAVVEGELLALSWTLESTQHFTLQNPRLIISTDHKPLVELVNNSTLTDLNKKNKRLCRLKERPEGIIILMDKRKVIPKSLRAKTCNLAHSAHQGVNNMMKTLETRVY